MRGFLPLMLAVLPVAAQTQVDLRTQARDVDFGAASSTRPVKTGTALPGTCAVGELFFKTDAAAGANLFGCAAANVWSAQGGIPSKDCWYDANDSTLKCRDASGHVFAAVKTGTEGSAGEWVDYILPTGVPHTSKPTAGAVGAVADPGTNGIPYRSGAGASTAANADLMSQPFACQDAGAVNAYACSLTPAITGYTPGTSYWFHAGNANTGTATINFNGLGPKGIVKRSNRQLEAGDILAGQWVMVTYDGIAMQMQSQTASSGNGATSSVFGRTGAVTAAAGDYTTAQVTESGNQYFTDARAQAAFSFPGVVKLVAGALDCPTCVTTGTGADTDLYGSFPHLSVVKLQGRRVAATAPADQQYLGWNSGAGQWEPRTLPAPALTSLFGRTGAVTAQAGDYSFGQIGGTLGATQLPAAAMRTDVSNTVSGGTQDMRAADHTLPIKSGPAAGLPATCAPGEVYFATDAAAGSNVYGCTAANTWSAQGTNLQIESDGVPVGLRTTANFVTGPGLMSLITDDGAKVDILTALDTAVVQTQAGQQAGGVVLCASTGGSNRDYSCAITPTLSQYKTGMVLQWKPDVNGVGGTTTLNVDTLGPVRVTLRDGVSDPGAADVMAGQLYSIWYDGAGFRLMMPTAGTMPGSVASVFGRQGAIAAQAGDYSTDQVTEGSKLYFTPERAQSAVAWGTLGGKPSGFPPLAHASTHQNGGGDEIATATPAANAIPKAGSDGKLNAGWLPAGSGGLGYTAEDASKKGQPNGYAGLDGSGKIAAGAMPVPGSASLGGVTAKDCGSQFVQKVNTDGSITCAAAAGGGGTGIVRASWVYGNGVAIAAADAIAVPWMATATGMIQKCYAAAGTGPVGAALVVDVKKNGASIFGANPKLTIADGQTAGSTVTFATATLAEGDLLTTAMVQVGSTAAGSNLSVVCTIQ